MPSRNGPRIRAFVAFAALAACAQRAAADLQQPGSLLLFQEFDNRPGITTLFTVTNSNTTDEVYVQFQYVESVLCAEFNRTELLTPNDTLTLLTDFQNPLQERGYAFAFARTPGPAGQAIAFDHLIGATLVIDGFANADYSVNPVVFRCENVAQGAPTDLDGDGERDLDGLEYSRGPDELLFPRFLGQEPEILVSELLLIDLSGGNGFRTRVHVRFFNDNEEAFSVMHEFSCWARVPLANLSSGFLNTFLQGTNHDPDEVVGAPGRESGWLRVDGEVCTSPTLNIQEPLVLGVLLERIAGSRDAGRPYHMGLQDQGVPTLPIEEL